VKILTLFGTRPEIIRLSLIVRRLDQRCEQLLVHTGQNYEPSLSDVFFDELGIRAPDVNLGVRAGTFAEQAAQIIERSGELLRKERPDRILILGDTNSGLAAIVAARMRIPVYHMEAGNRCFDDRVPEEINRRLIDHCSAVLLPYTHRSKEHLLSEGIRRARIFVIGNPIREVIDAQSESISSSQVLQRLGLEKGRYMLATLHRAENVDDPARLKSFLTGLAALTREWAEPVIVSVHPRTAARIVESGLQGQVDRLRLLSPFGFGDFVALEKQAMCVLSDSGTVQEECCIFGVPNVTLRDVTERPETIECGSNILSGADPASIATAVRIALDSGRAWRVPDEYLAPEVSSTVTKILLGFVPALDP
jgi:UDP-N-acetylglucosamine 2-epimerase (non-hydrolysing)